MKVQVKLAKPVRMLGSSFNQFFVSYFFLLVFFHPIMLKAAEIWKSKMENGKGLGKPMAKYSWFGLVRKEKEIT